MADGDRESGRLAIFLCHPFRSHPHRNARAVCALAHRLVLQDYLPIAPQIYLPQFLDEGTERDMALRCCLSLVALADEVWVFGEPTEGMRLEIAEARRLGIPVLDGVAEGGMASKGEPPR